MSDYQIVDKVVADGEIPVTLYVNKITGLRVVTAYVECPIVKGDLCFATEAFDDDGLPHTLEHLVFLGSEDYPYKGVLDLLANKCLSSGTNAFTDTDHTNYTLSTAGNDGFLNLLPIYLDHLLFPTLTDSAYLTEVHHINGEGENAGIVYCEMQARENSGESRCYLEMLRAVYPGKCGYKSETGGIVENLRNSTSNEKVRNYHKQFYHPKNLCVVVTGPVESEAIFKAIKPIEDKIVAKGLHKMEFDRPWQAPVEALDNSVHRKIQYSSDTDDDGLVYIAFRGPNVVDNFKELVAITILLDYLNSTAVSPIQRDFVESAEPFCSSVSHSVIENSTSLFYLAFESVGKQYLDYVANKLYELLKNILREKEKIAMDRMETIISRKRVRILSAAETSPHAIVIGPIIGHFLYGTTNFQERCQEIPILEDLSKRDARFWLNLIDKYMIGPDSRHACIVGEPSPELMKSLGEKEKERIAEQKEELKDQLPTFAERLKQAVEFNERPPPSAMMDSVKVPSTSNIKFHSIERVVLDEKLTPFRLQYDSIRTNFVTIHLMMDTSNVLSKTDRLYLPLLSEIILESPIKRGERTLTYEEVVAELFADTITHGVGTGLSAGAFYSVGTMSMLFTLVMQVEIGKYAKAVQWFNEILYKTIFTQNRIKTVATRMVSDISQYKRSGSKVVGAVLNGLAYQSNSNQWACSFLRQQKFLKQLLKDFKTKPESLTEIPKTLERIRNAMTRPENILVHIALNKDKIDVSNLHQPWTKMVPEEVLAASSKKHIELSNIIPCHKLFNPIEKPKTVVVGLGTVESNYLQQLVRSIDSPKHPDLPALHVLIQYLTQLEGPLWRQVRGTGFSYSYSIQVSPSDGVIYFVLAKSSRLVDAYNVSVGVVDRIINGVEELDDSLFASAKSSLVYELIKREKSAADKSMQSLLAYIRNLSVDFNKELIQRVANVTKEDLRRVAPTYLKPLFEDENKLTAVCCHPTRVEEVTRGLRQHKIDLETIAIDQEAFLNSFV